jgi:hypothetical protein
MGNQKQIYNNFFCCFQAQIMGNQERNPKINNCSYFSGKNQ